MKNWVLVVFILFTGLGVTVSRGEDIRKRQVGQFLLENVPSWDKQLSRRMRPYLSVRPTALLSLRDGGGGILVTTRFGETKQLHMVSRPMGARNQVTFSDEPILWARFVPGSNGRHIIFQSRDTGGNENYQFYELDMETNRSTRLTDGKSRHESPVISNNGRLLAFSGTGRNGRDHDIYLYDRLSRDPAKLLRQAAGMLTPMAFSPEDKKLLIEKYISERETHWFVLDIQGNSIRRVTPETQPFFHGGGVWGPKGETLYLISDCRGEFRKLYRITLNENSWECLTPDMEWDVEEVVVDPAGKGIAFVTNENGISRLYFSDLDGRNRRPVKLPPESVLIRGMTFAPNGGELGFTLTGARVPADAFTVTFPLADIRRWTRSEAGGMRADHFVNVECIQYATFDHVHGKPRMIPAFILRGRGRGPRPVVIHAHGGPEYQYKPVLSSEFQYWAVELGITVISPNIRGSTGYGRSFHQLDNGINREDAVRDIGSLLDWIDKQPDLDSRRVGIFGGSYGGYLVLGSLMNYPDRIMCGVDVVGVADFVKFLEQTSEYRRDLRRVEYGDERDPEVRKVLEAISPLHHVDKIHAALFVLHGREDTRVPIGEARQIVAKMRQLKRTVWFATALDEGHVFHKKQNRNLAAIMYTVFWQHHLLR